MEMIFLSRARCTPHSPSRLVALHCIHNFRNVSISRWPKFGTEQMAFTNGTVIFLNGFRLLRIIICEKYLKQFEAGLGLVRLDLVWLDARAHFVHLFRWRFGFRFWHSFALFTLNMFAIDYTFCECVCVYSTRLGLTRHGICMRVS